MEPLVAPPLPYHLLAQQVLALCLQLGRVGRHGWSDWIGRLPVIAEMAHADKEAIVDHMVDSGILVEEEGMLSIGVAGESTYGHKNFLDLFSIFSTPLLFTVLHGRNEVGQVHQITFFTARRDEPLVLTLGGRHWQVGHIDWNRQTAQVTPAEEKGRSRWLGQSAPLSFRLCQAMKAVLAGATPGARLSQRATRSLGELREEFAWLGSGSSGVVWDEESGRVRWWTFAGLRANSQLASAAEIRSSSATLDRNLVVDVTEPADVNALQELLNKMGPAAFPVVLDPRVLEEVKFHECLPNALLHRMMETRWRDDAALNALRAPSTGRTD